MGQFKWLDETLYRARKYYKRALLFAHIPPGKFERFYQYFEEEQQQGKRMFRSNLKKKVIKSNLKGF